MTKLIDITGQKFGKLTVIKKISSGHNKPTLWLCKCDCGNEKAINGESLKRGLTQSCGCVRKEVTRGRMSTHKMTNTRLYDIYRGMKERCDYKKHKQYNCYGGRGISVCQEWLDDFINFYNWAMANGYKEGLTIDRINLNGNYCPENCKWATMKEQANNTRRNNFITYKGETHSLTEWAKIIGIKRTTLSSRIQRSNWDIEKALTASKMKNQFG